MDHPKIFLGRHCPEERAFDVCLFAIQRCASDLVEIVPVNLDRLQAMSGEMPTEAGDRHSFDCSLAHFFVPALSGFAGWALFVSSDMLVQADIYDLWKLRDDRFAAMGVHRAGNGSGEIGGWSSLMLWNCGHPANRVLSAERVAAADRHWLDTLAWLDDSQIGRIPEEWSWLEGQSDPAIAPKIIEFAGQEPWHAEPGRNEVADSWHREARRVFGSIQAGIASAPLPSLT